MVGRYIAMQLLAPNALAFVQTSLGATYNESLGVAAPVCCCRTLSIRNRLMRLQWADTVREEKAYAWSAPLHFIDAEGMHVLRSHVQV